MCGISVVMKGKYQDASKMAVAIQRRGVAAHPYIDEDNDYVVYFNHLPITEPNSPYVLFEAGQYKCWLNGFISNYKELSEKYDIKLSSNCDTELLVKFLKKFKGNRLNELNGFFAVVYFDGSGVKYFTDRYGIKQLYQTAVDGTTFICSEVKGLLKVMEDVKLDERAVDDWKHALGVMTKHTIYEGIWRITKLPFIRPKKIDIDYESAKRMLKAFWKQSVRRNKVIGHNACVFLSGGIDSGLIAKDLKPDYSFSVDYIDDKYSEIERIKLNTSGIHHTLICNDALFNSYKSKALLALDDFKVGSCYTNFALSELASKFCTVNYSGAGGDEVFGGYPHRNNKHIDEVIRRTQIDDRNHSHSIDHDEYNWNFLQGVLIVEDRMAGYHTMETRFPLLDNDFVDFALSLPDSYLANKKILKDISGLHPDVISGKKQGFSNPHLSNEGWVNFTLDNLNHEKK